jgi:hypothetical protein
LELLLLILITEVVLLLALALVAGVISVVVVGGEVELLPLGTVGDEVGGVAALETTPR